MWKCGSKMLHMHIEVLEQALASNNIVYGFGSSAENPKG